MSGEGLLAVPQPGKVTKTGRDMGGEQVGGGDQKGGEGEQTSL